MASLYTLVLDARAEMARTHEEDQKLYAEIDAAITECLTHYQAGRYAEAHAAAERAANLEYTLCCDCEATGPLCEATERHPEQDDLDACAQEDAAEHAADVRRQSGED